MIIEGVKEISFPQVHEGVSVAHLLLESKEKDPQLEFPQHHLSLQFH